MAESALFETILVSLVSGGALTAIVTGVVFLRARQKRYEAEQARWAAAERMADKHGPDVLKIIPQLAKELREAGVEDQPVGAITQFGRRVRRR